jgi:hypothetical protein
MTVESVSFFSTQETVIKDKKSAIVVACCFVVVFGAYCGPALVRIVNGGIVGPEIKTNQPVDGIEKYKRNRALDNRF